MKKIRKLIYNYVFKRVVAWREGRIEDQELTDALYTYCDTNLKEAKICGEHPRFGCQQEMLETYKDVTAPATAPATATADNKI